MFLFTEISDTEIFTVLAVAVFLFIIGPLWFIWYRKQEQPNSLAKMIYGSWIFIYLLFALALLNALIFPS
jgi:hypothetical protein